MIKNTIQMFKGAPVEIRLREADDAGFATVNSHHFALALDEALDVSGSLRLGTNKLRLVVDNTGAAVPFVGNLPGGKWSGRFELYIAGSLVGAYADKGNDGPGKKQHVVAEIELLVAEPPAGETGEGKAVSWWWKLLGY